MVLFKLTKSVAAGPRLIMTIVRMEIITGAFTVVSSLLLNTHAVEIWAVADRVGVRITRCTGLSHDIALNS